MKVLREKETALSNTPHTTPPPEFLDHAWHITRLTEHIEDKAVRVELLNAIEVLVHNMNGPWQGCRVGWQNGQVPDDLSGLEGLFDAD